jgi:ATP-dependent RNA helicase SUPV3L1/SUV3
MASQDKAAPAGVRAILAMLVDQGGSIARAEVAEPLAGLDREQRRMISRLKVRIGALDLFIPAMLKPEAMRWRAALQAAAAGSPMPALPPQSAVVLPSPSEAERALLARLGFRGAGPQKARAGRQQQVVDQGLTTSLGLQPQAVARLMKDVGFHPSGGEGEWVWKGRAPRRSRPPVRTGHAFAALAELRRG